MKVSKEALQAICEQVQSDFQMGGLAEDGGLYSDYAKEVARRALDLVGAKTDWSLHGDENEPK